jgi:hypothetical protein
MARLILTLSDDKRSAEAGRAVGAGVARLVGRVPGHEGRGALQADELNIEKEQHEQLALQQFEGVLNKSYTEL